MQMNIWHVYFRQIEAQLGAGVQDIRGSDRSDTSKVKIDMNCTKFYLSFFRIYAQKDISNDHRWKVNAQISHTDELPTIKLSLTMSGIIFVRILPWQILGTIS